MTIDTTTWIKRDLNYNLDTQRVYVGSNARTYIIVQTDNPTGCWAILNGDGGHPIPTEDTGGTFEANASTIDLQLQDTNRNPLRSIFWIDIGKHPNIYVGTPGINLVTLAPHQSQQIYANTTDRVFRFSAGDPSPSGLWVQTDAATKLQPIPTAPTCIDVEGKTVTLVSQNAEERQVMWLDIT
jgi:hypothetical protein